MFKLKGINEKVKLRINRARRDRAAPISSLVRHICTGLASLSRVTRPRAAIRLLSVFFDELKEIWRVKGGFSWTVCERLLADSCKNLLCCETYNAIVAVYVCE